MESFDPAELPELLKLYYRRLFPYPQYYRWLNYGGGNGGWERDEYWVGNPIRTLGPDVLKIDNMKCLSALFCWWCWDTVSGSITLLLDYIPNRLCCFIFDTVSH